MRNIALKAPVLFLTFVLSLIFATVPFAPAWSACDTSTQYTYNFTNYCAYPVWIGERSTGDHTSYPPEGGNWALSAVCAQNADCASGTCDTGTGQCTCTSSTQCSGGATCVSNRCSISAQFCMPQNWPSGTFWPRTGCTLDASVTPKTLTCKTGACYDTTNTGKQLLDCSVNNNGGSPTNPVTQFEVTSTSSALNYDISIAAGFNVETHADPVGGGWIEAGTPATNVAACLSAGCTADLNRTCPENLRVYDSTSVIGCLDPCTRCNRGGAAGLNCSSTFAGETYTDCGGQTGNVTYEDMYCAKNMADGNAMSSANQGTPTAFGPSDCFHDKSFVQPTFSSSYALPANQGVCLYTANPQTGIPHFNDYGWHDAAAGKDKNCGGFSPDYVALADGTACGGYLTLQTDGAKGYPDGLGYTCQTATYTDSLGDVKTAHLCMPPTYSGLGTCHKDNSGGGVPLYDATGGVLNPSWLTAAITAGSNGVPYYETFKAACPTAYTWQYDDSSSGFACTTTLKVTNGNTFTGFNVTFCKNSSPFCVAKAVRIDGSATGYDYIHQAYVAASSTKTIQARAVTISENLSFDGDKEISLAGGYDCTFSTQSGVTTINGSMTVAAGQATIDRVTIR